MSEDELMGRNEYARHRGVAPNAVAKAIDSGRIAKAVVRAGGRFKGIKWRQADALWLQNTDPAQAERSRKHVPQGPAAPAVQTSAPRHEPRSSVERLLSQTIADSLLIWAGQLVAELEIDGEKALGLCECLAVAQFQVLATRLGVSLDDLQICLTGPLLAAARPEERPAVIEDIVATAAIFRAEAASAAAFTRPH